MLALGESHGQLFDISVAFLTADDSSIKRDNSSDSGNEREPKVCVQQQEALCSSLRHCNSASRKIKSCTRGPFKISYMIVNPRV